MGAILLRDDVAVAILEADRTHEHGLMRRRRLAVQSDSPDPLASLRATTIVCGAGTGRGLEIDAHCRIRNEGGVDDARLWVKALGTA